VVHQDHVYKYNLGILSFVIRIITSAYVPNSIGTRKPLRWYNCDTLTHMTCLAAQLLRQIGTLGSINSNTRRSEVKGKTTPLQSGRSLPLRSRQAMASYYVCISNHQVQFQIEPQGICRNH